jgi:hypothetical protein
MLGVPVAAGLGLPRWVLGFLVSRRQNLALVVGLQGRFPEAEQIARRELSPQQADANVAYLRGMLSQQNSWQKLAAKDTTSVAASNTN